MDFCKTFTATSDVEFQKEILSIEKITWSRFWLVKNFIYLILGKWFSLKILNIVRIFQIFWNCKKMTLLKQNWRKHTKPKYEMYFFVSDK